MREKKEEKEREEKKVEIQWLYIRSFVVNIDWYCNTLGLFFIKKDLSLLSLAQCNEDDVIHKST